ncbi:MAG TPA: RNA 2',3'-cyclic phosphodiesterase [Burkholderiaceae bacterium]
MSAAPTRRLFIGLMPDDAVRDAIVAHQSHWYWDPRGRRTRAAKLHLTLHFLGEVDAASEQALRESLAGESVAPFDLVLRTPARWTNHIAVLQPDAHPALDDLRARLARRLLRAGLEPHMAGWAPHVTLARDVPNAAPPEAMRPIPWTVTDFALVWSRLGRGASYEVLERYGAG